MASGVSSWSTTAASNATADSNVNWAEGQAPSSVNDSARAMMASVKKWQNDISGTITTGGTSTAYTITTNQVFASAAAMSGAFLVFIPHATCGAAPTLAVDGLTARNINTSTGVNVATGALLVGTPYAVTYIHASTEFILLGALGVLGATSVSSLTVTGATALNGGLTMDSTAFTVADTSGNTAIAGTLAVTGATTVAGLTASGAISGATAAGAMIATQAQEETGTAVNVLSTPGRQHFHPLHPKAWCNFNGTGTPGVTVGSGVTSITDNGTGDYTVNWTTAFSTANYGSLYSAGANTGASIFVAPDRNAGGTQSNPAAASQQITTFTTSFTANDSPRVYVGAFGDFA